MELNPRAFSADGFIIRQYMTQNLTFGVCSNDRNGCGWIAAYNLLRATGYSVAWEKVYTDLSRRLLFRGRMGVHLVVLLGYLAQQGCRLRCAVTLTGSRLLAEHTRAGILLYGTGHSTHYVTCIRQADGRLRFLNAGAGRDDVVMTMREFYRDIVQFPVFFFVGVA